MTRKDYIKIAGAIKDAYTSLSYASTLPAETKRATEIIALTIAKELYRDNNRFNEDRFLKACGTE